MDRIDALLGTVSDPSFGAVLRGEPLSIARTPTVAFWLTSREVSFMTLKDVSSFTQFTVRAYFRMQASQDVRESTELDIWDAVVNIDSALNNE